MAPLSPLNVPLPPLSPLPTPHSPSDSASSFSPVRVLANSKGSAKHLFDVLLEPPYAERDQDEREVDERERITPHGVHAHPLEQYAAQHAKVVRDREDG